METVEFGFSTFGFSCLPADTLVPDLFHTTCPGFSGRSRVEERSLFAALHNINASKHIIDGFAR
jgi:hypothetical protein